MCDQFGFYANCLPPLAEGFDSARRRAVHLSLSLSGARFCEGRILNLIDFVPSKYWKCPYLSLRPPPPPPPPPSDKCFYWNSEFFGEMWFEKWPRNFLETRVKDLSYAASVRKWALPLCKFCAEKEILRLFYLKLFFEELVYISY